MICALLLGRHGSAGLPGKNIYPVLGRPLIAYPLMAARDSTRIDRTYESTDSAAIHKARVGLRRCGAPSSGPSALRGWNTEPSLTGRWAGASSPSSSGA